MKKKLRVGEIDFIVSKKPYSMESDLLFIPIGILHNCFVVNSLYPDLIHETVPVSDLVKYPILLQSAPSSSHDSIIQFCLQHNVELHSIMDIASSSLLVDFVKICLGVGYVIKEYVSKELEQRELFIVRTNPVLPTEEFGILFLKNTPLSFSANCLYSLILDDKKTF